MRRSAVLFKFCAVLGLSICPAIAQVQIHEVLYDGVGSDEDEVFTELTGPPGMLLDGWSVEGVNGGSGTVYRSIALDGVTMPADGVLTIATASALGAVQDARDLVGSVDWQNGPDAIRIVDPDGQVADALQYGDAGVNNVGEGAPAARTAAGESLSRNDLGVDTHDNAADFSVSSPTPGIAITALPPGATLSLPDTLGHPGQVLELPLSISDNEAGLLAAEVAIIFDAQVLTPVTVTPATLTSNWQVAAHVTQGADWQDTLRIALATDVDTLKGDAALLRLTFRVQQDPHPAQALLHLTQAVLDDGSEAAGLVDGSLLRVGVDATLAGPVAGFALPHEFELVVDDPDEDRTADRDTVRVEIAEGDTTLTVHLIEDDLHSARFRASIMARHDVVDPEDAELQLRPRQPTLACYTDRLTAAGTTLDRCFEIVPRGHDAVLRASRVIEPEDTLWIRVQDRDLNRDSLTREDAVVTIHSSSDSLVHPLRALDEAAMVFDAPWTSTSADSVGGLTIAAGDTIVVTYLDTAAATADLTTRSDTVFVIDRFGDADGNGVVQAFDANAILHHVITPHLAAVDSLAANVDSLAPSSAVTPLDASLILQQRVGQRHRFPVQLRTANNHPGPQAEVPTTAARISLLSRQVTLRRDDGDLVAWADDRAGIVAAELKVHGILASGAPAGPPGYLVAYGRQQDRWHIALAGALPLAGPGPLVRWRDAEASSAVQLAHVSLNDVLVRVQSSSLTTLRPSRWRLAPNRPNPFNGQTIIPVILDRVSQVEVTILNALGQPIRRFPAQRLGSGEHAVHWDGADDEGRLLATGVYLVRVRVDDSVRHQGIMLLR